MSLFHIIDGANAIIRTPKTGVYKQVKVYERGGDMFVAASGGYIRLMRDKRTSNPNVLWEYVDVQHTVSTGVLSSIRYVQPPQSVN